MNAIFNLIEGFEKLAYRILMWFIFIPKTLIKVTVDPDWASGYVKDELKQEKSPFDEYMSPVVLLLTVALIPAILLNFLPNYQVVVTKVAEEETTAQAGTIESWLKQNNQLAKSAGDVFEATADFASSSTQLKYEFEWYVEEAEFDENGYMTSYHEIQGTRESHSESNEEGSSIVIVDNNTARDRFDYRFTKSGGYYINVQVWKIDPDKNLPVESYTDYIYVFVPETENTDDLKGLVSESRSKLPSATSGPKLLDALTGELKSESTVFLALAMLLPPLLFAFASRFVTGKEISENSLREVFYEECYYFAPLSLAGWASVYAVRLFTSDVFFYKDLAIAIVGLPVILAIVRFMTVQVRAIVRDGEVQEGEQKIRKISPAKAFLVVVICIILIGMVVTVVYLLQDAQGQDILRVNLIRFYILGSVGLLAWYLWRWNQERRNANRKLSRANIIMLGTFAFVLLCVFGCILIVPATPRVAPTPMPTLTTAPLPDATATLAASPTQSAIQTTPTELSAASPTEGVNPFYTEEFNGNLDTWTDFMTNGNAAQVNSGVEDGKLTIQLSPDADIIPLYYFINTAFAYTDVQVEAIVTNNGNNANGASLICRLSDKGWYEFWISNSGYYEIYAFDGTDNSYNTLFTGGSPTIRSGTVTNVYTAICKGNELTLLINGEQVRSVTDIQFKFSEGNIGVGASSPQTLPVDLEFESVTVSEP